MRKSVALFLQENVHEAGARWFEQLSQPRHIVHIRLWLSISHPHTEWRIESSQTAANHFV